MKPTGGNQTYARRWRPGGWWNLPMVDDRGVERGFVLHEVTGCGRVRDALAYRILVTRIEWGHSPGLAEAPRVEEIRHGVAPLHRVWDVCGRPASMGGCQGRVPEWDFPLHDGRTWTYHRCGDMPIPLHGRATLGRGDVWTLAITEPASGARVARWTDAPALGLLTRLDGTWGNGPGARVGHGHGDPPRPSPAPGPHPPGARLRRRGRARPQPLRAPAGPVERLARGAARAPRPRDGGPARRGALAAGRPRRLEHDPPGRVETPPARPAEGGTFASWSSARDLRGVGEAGAEPWMREALGRLAIDRMPDPVFHAEPTVLGWRPAFHQSLAGRPVLLTGGSLDASDRRDAHPPARRRAAGPRARRRDRDGGGGHRRGVPAPRPRPRGPRTRGSRRSPGPPSRCGGSAPPTRSCCGRRTAAGAAIAASRRTSTWTP